MRIILILLFSLLSLVSKSQDPPLTPQRNTVQIWNSYEFNINLKPEKLYLNLSSEFRFDRLTIYRRDFNLNLELDYKDFNFRLGGENIGQRNLYYGFPPEYFGNLYQRPQLFENRVYLDFDVNLDIDDARIKNKSKFEWRMFNRYGFYSVWRVRNGFELSFPSYKLSPLLEEEVVLTNGIDRLRLFGGLRLKCKNAQVEMKYMYQTDFDKYKFDVLMIDLGLNF